MLTVPQALALAMQQHRTGQLSQAEQICRAILQVQPQQVDALHLLSLLASQVGQHERAGAYLSQVVRLQPDSAAAHYNLGTVFQDQGQLAEARACYQQAVRLEPVYVEAHYNLGNILKEQGQREGAQASYEQALRLQPDYAAAHNNLGNLLQEQGRLAEAQACYQQVLRLRPDSAAAHSNLGNVHKEQGQLAEAVVCYQQALHLQPDLAEAHYNLGNLLKEQGQLDEAALSYEHALRLRPFPSLQIARATLLPPLYTSSDAIAAWRARLQENLTQLHRAQVRVDLTQEPAHPLFYLAYQGLDDRDIQRDTARLYVAPSASAGQLSAGRRSGEDRIRVGFVSRFFRNHTIGELFRGTIAHLARDAFAVTVFSLGHARDATAQFIQAQADTYVELSTNLTAARQQIAGHELDVLVYADIGMEELSYSLAFSRLAPVQCVLWGHPVTTGIETMDYFLSSELLESAEAEQHYTETLVRLPTLPVYYYRPVLPNPLQGRSAFGLPEQGHLYGCPQSLFKLHPEFDPILREILQRDPQGWVVLLHGKHSSWAEKLRQRFAITLGEMAERILFLDRLAKPTFLNLNAVVDVLLDPIHFGGGNTSYEGLALGVPIVTLPSPFLRGRITLALYRQMQVLDCVVATPKEYIELAVRLGTEPDYRAHLRAKIQQANGVLYDNVAGVRALEEFLHSAVRQA